MTFSGEVAKLCMMLYNAMAEKWEIDSEFANLPQDLLARIELQITILGTRESVQFLNSDSDVIVE